MSLRIKSYKTYIAIIISVFLFANCVYAAPTIKALIVDGQNNHDWAATTPVLKEILEECGLFKVDVATSPAQGKSMEDFTPDFSQYQVVVLNYTGDSWPKQTNDAFVEYVKNGGGVVVFHAADNAFPEWVEFNEIIGLGGWGNRDEKSGPMIRYRDGKIIRDNSPGAGGTHGPQREYAVTARDKDHPIVKGLPDSWMHAKDELYSKLRGPAKNLHVISTSLSMLTKEHEPSLFTIEYGKGKIFHTVLGHGPFAMQCVGFAFTLQRGTEWAATGQVTLNDIPANFPTAEHVSYRQKSVSLDEIKNYKYGASRASLNQFEANIRNAAPTQLKDIEVQLQEVLGDAQATFFGKQFACRMLRRIGTEDSIPALQKLLADEKLSNMARFALQGIPSSEVDAVLRQALQELDGDLRIGVIGAIAQRGDARAVGQIAKWLESGNLNLSRAAIKALGQIGGQRAANALSKANVASELQALRDDSLLLCADGFVEKGKAIYQNMTDADYPVTIRLAAYRGIIQLDNGQALPIIKSLLKDKELKLKQAAVGPFFALVPGSNATLAIMDGFSTYDDTTKSMVLKALAMRGDSSVVPAIVDAIGTEQGAVKIAAIETLGVLGCGDHVEMLAKIASGEGDIGKAAAQSILTLRGIDVDQTIIELLKNGASNIQAALINSLIARRSDGAINILLERSLDADLIVRQASISGLKSIAQAQDIPNMLKLIPQLENQSDIISIEDSIISVAEQVEDAARITQYLLSASDDASTNLRVSVMRLLSKFGGEKAGRVVVEALNSDSAKDVRKAAFKALTNWPDASPIDTLFGLFKESDNSDQRQVALTGYLRMIDLTKDEPIGKTIERYQAAMDAASDKSEKELIVKAISYRANVPVLEFLEKCLNDQDLLANALDAYKKVVKQLEKSDSDRSAWDVTASHNKGDAKNAIDGNRNSRWATGTPQVKGQWFQIDLKSERVIQEITLDAAGSSGDYPRGYEVYLSFNDKEWGQPVAQGKGDKPLVVIPIPSKSARFIRIVQTGKVDGLYWSIHDLNVKVSSSKEQLEHAYEVLKKYE